MDTRSRKLTMHWQFPLPDTHAGILMGNGLFGTYVWGDERLCLTINRADFWDRRGYRPITAKMNYADLQQLWATEDRAGFAQAVPPLKPPPAPQIPVPSGLPMGRIELGLRIAGVSLKMADGLLQLAPADGGKALGLAVAADLPLLLIETERTDLEITPRPAWDFLGDYLRSIGHQAPEMFQTAAVTGWLQRLPADPCLCLACGRLPGGLAIAAVYGQTPAAAKANADALLKQAAAEGVTGLIRSAKRRWHRYWRGIPQVNLPSKDPEDVYYYGLFKLAAMAQEHPALLQGPWVEEYQMPDCSNDFHFNVNVQMCYWPVYNANCLELLHPLFDRLKEWEPQLRRNAKLLFDVEDGLFLPMAVGDTGEWICNYWPSFTDLATTGWVAHLMWLYYRYSLDIDFLRRTAYPFMKGSMRVYEAALKEEDGRMILPMGTSPEYNWSTFAAAGRNPSFQLACIHFLLESLVAAAALLDVDREQAAVWQRLKQQVPPYTTFTAPDPYPVGCQRGPGSEYAAAPRIAILEGQDLESSHRHHSHLAALHPFDTIDPEDEDVARLLKATLRHWVETGPGNWIAFSFVWASIIQSRMRNGEAAHLHYRLWQRLFVNEQRGALELALFPGLTTWSSDESESPMQMDAAMGAVAAIQEMLLHTVRGVLRVFPAVPRAWRKAVSFDGMRAEGAFLVSAAMTDGRIDKVEIVSEQGAPLRLANNIAAEIVVRRGSKEERTTAALLTLHTQPGETLTVEPGRERR